MPPVMGLTAYNDQFLVIADHFDEFMISDSLVNPNIWIDRIPRGAYQLYNGLEQKTNIYRGGLPVQAGLSTWTNISNSRKPSQGDPGYDNCNPGTPQRYKYAFETLTYTGLQDHWQSDPVCLNDMKFVDYAKDQLALIVKTGVDFGVSMLENWNREQYVLQAMHAGRGMVLATGSIAFEDDAAYRFDYDPFSTVADVDGDQVPYITFSADLDISTLNFDFLDYLRTSLAARAHGAAIGTESGMPVYGLMIDLIDFEKMIKSDPDLREDWRNAQPTKLIDGYAMGMKVYRGFALIHDARQMRFRVKEIDANGQLVATRVLPLRGGRAATVGLGRVPEPNPDYYNAEIGIGVVFMNDVLQNLFVPSIDNLGSGMSFGPMPGLTGTWKWINIPDPVTNMLGETGFFYGRFQIFPKPLLYSFETTVFAYSRCPQALRTKCKLQSNTDVATGAVAITADAVAADYDATNRRITLTLTSLINAGVGDTVTIKKAGNATFTARVLETAFAPKYKFGWAATAKDSASADAVAGFADFTAAVTTVTA